MLIPALVKSKRNCKEQNDDKGDRNAQRFLDACDCLQLPMLGGIVHPQALTLVRAVYVVFALLWMLSWMLDDWLVLRLRVNILTLQGVLVSGLAASVVGLGVMLCRS